MTTVFPRTDIPTSRGGVGTGGGVAQATTPNVGFSPTSSVYRHPEPKVLWERNVGEGEFSVSLKPILWNEIVLGQDGQQDTAALQINMLDVEVPGITLSALKRFMAPDRKVRIVAPWGGSGGDGESILFEGYPMVSNIQWQPGRHSISVQCVGVADEAMRFGNQHIIGQRLRTRPWEPWNHTADNLFRTVGSLPVIFNMGGKPNRTVDFFTFGEGDDLFHLHLFVDLSANEGIESTFWTYAQAIRYLVYHYMILPGSIVSGLEFMADTQQIEGEANIGLNEDQLLYRLNRRVIDQSVESLSIDEALAALILRAGLHYHYWQNPDTGQYVLRVYATIGSSREADAADPSGTSQMGRPAVLDVERQEPFADLTADTDADIAKRNRHQNASLIYDYRGVNGTIRRGGAVEYQVGVLLRPGWYPINELDDPIALVPPPTDPPTDPLPDQTGVTQAETFWAVAFTSVGEIGPQGEVTGVPNTVFNSSHPEHSFGRVGALGIATPVQSQHDPIPSDVFRRWVFPDSWRYMINFESPDEDNRDPYSRPDRSQQPFGANAYKPIGETTGWNILSFDFIGAGLVAARDWVPRNRPFKNMIGRHNASVTDQSPLVLVNFTDTTILQAHTSLRTSGGSDKWLEFQGGVTIDPDVAAIRFTDANFWDSAPFLKAPWEGRGSLNAVQAYLRGHFWVAVVATIQSDDRMASSGATAWSSSRQRKRVQDYGLTRFVRRVTDEGSNHPLTGADEVDPQYMGRDQTAEFDLQSSVDIRQTGVIFVSGDPESFYIDTEPRIGDSYSGAPGMGLDFPTFPSVQSIRYTNVSDDGGSYRTTMHLTDMRTAPEVNTE